ncbi:MAG: hypothetical protein MZV70_29710 [Desulfobacterales bacterium]|nr:hypothetical protein [Desulfobacterales bacterium]
MFLDGNAFANNEKKQFDPANLRQPLVLRRRVRKRYHPLMSGSSMNCSRSRS